MHVLTKAAVEGTACGLMIGAVLLVGGRVWRPGAVAAQVPALPAVVRARSFEVVGAAGKTRASLCMLPDGSPVLHLSDAAGKTRVSLSVFSDGSPALDLSDAAGRTRATLSMLPDGTSGLVQRDTAEKVRVGLIVLPDGSPSLTMSDATGETRAILGTTSLEVVKTGEERTRSESSLVLFSKDGKVIWTAP